MRVINFPNMKKNKPVITGKDWSQQEIADFYRAHRLLVENGAGIGIDRGVTDIGEPWMVFFDTGTHDVFMHVARIEDKCILVCESLGIKFSAANIPDLIASFETTVRERLTVQTSRGNVVLHPAAKIIMAISAVFLMYKLDNHGVAYAKGMAGQEHGGTEAAATRNKADVVVTARAQSALTWLFDTIDSPRAVAALAGVILTSELLLNAPVHNAEAEHATHEVAVLAPIPASEQTPVLFKEDVKPAEVDAVQKIETVKPVVETASAAAVVISDTSPQQVQFHENFDIAVKDAVERSQPVVSITPPAHMISTQPDVAMIDVKAQAAAAQVTAPQTNTVQASSDQPQAVKALETFLGRSLDTINKVTTTTTAASATAAMVNVALVNQANANIVTTSSSSSSDSKLTDISLASLQKVHDVAGFFMQTSLSNNDLQSMLSHFMNNLGAYDVEYNGRQILVEESDANTLTNANIGLWTNVMQDGSTISIVGHAALIDDVAHLVA